MVDFTKPVTTRAGYQVKIFTTEGRKKSYPVVGEMYIGGEWMIYAWTADGKNMTTGKESDYNLINPPEEIEGWINVYPYKETIGFRSYKIYPTKEWAVSGRDNDCMATIPIKFKEGEGL